MTEPTITEFLLARIAEDREIALAAAVMPYGDVVGWGDHILSAERDSTPAMDEHVMRWDPARVLAECEAKRRIVELHPTYKAAPYKIEGGEMYYPPDPYYCDCQCPDGIIYGHDPCETKRVLAAPYADHPDYREEWKP